MSKSEVLYVKGMNTSDTDDDDQWDDKKLNDAYDKAVKIANIEVAKRVAMSTNTASDHNGESIYSMKKEKKGKSSMKKDQMPKVLSEMMGDQKPKEGVWKPGMHCRLVYSEDGLEYEAVIVSFVDNDDCVVRYLGYNNQEVVSKELLMPSHGMEARARQVVEARSEQPEDCYGAMSPLRGGDLGGSDWMPSPDSNDRTCQKKKKPSKKKKNQSRNINFNSFEFPEIPTMPNLSVLRNQLGSTDIPMPPPPMAFATSLDRSDSEEQAISSMLLSWYMSGYYTGLYQGMKRAKEGQGRRN